MNTYEPYKWGGNSSPPTNSANGANPFDLISSQPSLAPQEHGAPVSPTSYNYPNNLNSNQIPGASDVYQALISPISPTSSSTSRDTGRDLYRPAPQSTVVSQRDISGGQAQDYRTPSAWPASSPSDSPVHAGGPSRSNSHARSPVVDYSSTQPSLGGQRRPSDQHLHYDPPSPPVTRENTRMAVDATQPKCVFPGCQYPAYFNVAEQEQKEYCGHGHEIEAVETGFAKPCAMCKGRPRRTGERVCGPVCRDRERQAFQVQGSYYGAQVTRREPQTRPR